MRLRRLSGKYVIAVSGGVDSVVLLDLMSKQPQGSNGLELIVAHFDHGMRPDSGGDCQFVENLAKKYGLKFYSKKGNLGERASEQQARDARYSFLNDVVSKESANGLITAHHQDDLIETAIINIIRGTGRKGLASLNSTDRIVRPLLNYSKSDITGYAKNRKLAWQEDSTNSDLKYLRNYIRHRIVPRLDSSSRQQLVSLIKRQAELNSEIDSKLSDILESKATDNQLPRLWLNSLDATLSAEVLAAWLRQNGLRDFDRSTIERLSSNLKTVKTGKKIDILSHWTIISSTDNLALVSVER